MKAKIASGKVVHKEGKYFLEAEGKMDELPLSKASAAQIKEAVGKEIEVLLSPPQVSVIGVRWKNFCFIMCYIPANPFGLISIPEKALAVNLVERFKAEGLISEEIAKKFTE
jgi:hypothetical protein